MHKTKFLLFGLLLLAVSATAQLYNGMPQPERVRSVHSYNITHETASGFVMLRLVDVAGVKPYLGVSYNPAGEMKAHGWVSFNMVGQHLWILPMVSYQNANWNYDLATTLHLDKRKVFRANYHLLNLSRGGVIDSYISTIGVRPFKWLAFNSGVSRMGGNVGYTGNLRLWLYRNNWVEFRHNQRVNSINLFIHFN